MTSINAVTVVEQEGFLFADPGSIQIGRWDAGILSLDLPDGDRRRVPCSDVDEAVHEAMLTWNTAEGFVTLERWIGARRAEVTRTGERRHEWQESNQLVALVDTKIQQAVKDGILPMPNDYCVTWRNDENAIYIHTNHAWLESLEIEYELDTLLRPFNASTAGDVDADGNVFEREDFSFEVYPRPSRRRI
jgi:hypothetical protein